MTNQLSNPIEAIGLLKTFLHEEQSQHQAITTSLHAKNGILSAVALNLGIIEGHITNGKKVKVETIKELIEAVNDVSNELRLIEKKIFPSVVYSIGVKSPLNQFIRNCSNQFNVEIEYSGLTTDPIKNKKPIDVGIYKICTETIEYLCLSGTRKILIGFTLKKNILEVEITATPAKKQLQQKPELNKKLQLIKAMLVWQEVKIFPATDWKSVFKISFNLQ